MICNCGQEIVGTSYGWRICTYNNKNEIVYAVCQHGIVCINRLIELIKNDNMIDTLEDLKLSCINHGIGLNEIEIQRMQNRVNALDYAIELLKKEIK